MTIYWARILGMFLSLFFLLYIFHLVRKKKLHEEYSVFWVFLGFLIFILSLWKKLLIWTSTLLHLPAPIFTIFFFGLFLLLCICLYFSVRISDLQKKINILAQKFTLKKEEKQVED